MRNTDHLKDLACPRCEEAGPLSIGCSVLVEYDDDGPISHSRHEWDEDSYCQCRRCGYDGVVKDFVSETPPCTNWRGGPGRDSRPSTWRQA